MKKTLLAVPLLSAALLLVACGASNSGNEGSTAPSTGSTPSSTESSPATASTSTATETSEVTEQAQGDYAFAIGNTIGKFTIPGQPDKGFMEIMKRYDDDVSMFTSVNVKVDNRQSDVEAGIIEIRGYDAAGKEYLFLDPVDILDAMFQEDQSKMDYDKEYMKYFDEFTDSASPGEVDEFLLMSGDKLPDEFAKIIVNAGGMVGEVEAVTMEEAKAQGIPLDF